MVITILNAKSEIDVIIPACIPHDSAIQAAKTAVREAALHDIKLTAVDEDGESVFDAEFEMLIQFIPHARRIASDIKDNPAAVPMFLSGSPQLADLISSAITEYFQKQIAIGQEYLAMPESKRQKMREQLFGMMFSSTAA
ncbi:hypothetical protein [Buttiauxella sp. S19-1]|uniref:hypothetical protein n=1 Tax=Buttiauxella sp. S19-1 TaxID=941430 RepID=UPI001ED9EE04|nr:hypothetical protein [Buttiauxella sp. S19-1]